MFLFLSFSPRLRNRYIDFLIKLLSNNELSLLQAMEERMSKQQPQQQHQQEGERILSPPINSGNNMDSNSNSNGSSSGPGGRLIAPEQLSYMFSVWRMGGDFTKAQAM